MYVYECVYTYICVEAHLGAATRPHRGLPSQGTAGPADGGCQASSEGPFAMESCQARALRAQAAAVSRGQKRNEDPTLLYGTYSVVYSNIVYSNTVYGIRHMLGRP